MKIFLGLIVMLVCFSACEKTIDLKPDNLTPLLVVDGSIETNQPPFIILSSSLSYFSNISPDILSASQVHKARVIISDGVLSHQLKEYIRPVGNGYTVSYYTLDSSSLATAVIGQPGKTYQLTIEALGKKFTATTSIPVLAKKVDSLWWKNPPGIADSNKAVLMAKVTDPPGYGNYIRYFTRANSGAFLPGANSVFDDQVVDGSTYEVHVDQGLNRNDPPKFEDSGFFNRGDTVTLKFTNIDKSTYNFWRTLEYSYQSIGNPFSSPATIINNVKGALGSFCGYSVQYKTLIIPK